MCGSEKSCSASRSKGRTNRFSRPATRLRLLEFKVSLRVSRLLSLVVRVRHDVAGGIVTLRCHQRFCPLYPIGTCVAGNGGVRSSRDNVSSLCGVVVKA